MAPRLEVFADITCPFTHIGLKRVVSELGRLDGEIELVVRAWPLEWVNGTPLDSGAVQEKVNALRSQLGSDYFTGFRRDAWPTTSIPALNLAAAAFARDPVSGVEVSLRLRDALFEEGLDVSDAQVLASIAADHGLDAPASNPSAQVTADYEDGQRRGVRGSPDFWLEDEEFFCPALTLGHDEQGLTASFDAEGFDAFMDRVRLASQG